MSESESVANEVVRLHDFFQDWFSGTEDRSIEEFSDALDDAFYIVAPRGSVSDKETIVGMVASRRGMGRVQIRVENVDVRFRGNGDMLIATYEEHQERQTESAILVSTVGLTEDGSCPGGYRWLFVHETFYGATPSSR